MQLRSSSGRVAKSMPIRAAEAVVPRHNIKVRFLNAGCGIRLSSIRRVPADAFAHRHRVASGGSARRARTDAGSPADCTPQSIRHPTSTASDGFTSRPCSSHVTPTSASIATSSRRRPGVRRRPTGATPCAADRGFHGGRAERPQLFASIVRHGDRRLPLRHRGHHPPA